MTDKTLPNYHRITCGFLGLWYAGIAVPMLLDPGGWYASTPGVPSTGPMNSHFIRDIGAAFLMTGIAFAIATGRSASWAAVTIGAIFPTIHGGIHAFGLLIGHSHDSATTDFFGVVMPGALSFLLALQAITRELKKEKI